MEEEIQGNLDKEWGTSRPIRPHDQCHKVKLKENVKFNSEYLENKF